MSLPRRVLWLVANLIMVAPFSPLLAQEPVAPPGPPPRFAVVAKVDREAEQLDVLLAVSKPVYETKQRDVVVDGKTQTQTYTVCRWVAEAALSQVPLSNVRVVTAGKERLETAAALERLQPGQVVLMQSPGLKFDARYLSILHPETIILIEKAEAAAVPGAPNAPRPAISPPLETAPPAAPQPKPGP